MAGGMYDGSMVQNLDTDRIPSRRRNPIIADIFNRMNYMERRGSGFKKIKSDYHKEVNYNEGLEPKFYSNNTSFWVTLYNLNYNVPIEDKVDIDSKKVDIDSKKVDIGFMDTCLVNLKVNKATREKMRTAYFKFGVNTVFGRTQIAELLDISFTSASVLIKKMDKAGLLEKVTGQGKGKYRFK